MLFLAFMYAGSVLCVLVLNIGTEVRVSARFVRAAAWEAVIWPLVLLPWREWRWLPGSHVGARRLAI